MKSVFDVLRQLLENEGEIRKIAIVYQVKGQAPTAAHNFDRQAEAIAFVTQAMRLSDAEWLDILRGRP